MSKCLELSMGANVVKARTNFAGLLMLPGLIGALRQDKETDGPSVVSILRSIQEDEDPGRCIVRKCRGMLEPSRDHIVSHARWQPIDFRMSPNKSN